MEKIKMKNKINRQKIKINRLKIRCIINMTNREKIYSII